MQNKRGVDAIVATVLIIMITVAAVAILWAFVIPMVKDSLSSSTSEKVSLSIETDKGYTVYDSVTNYSFVQVKRAIDDVNLTALKFTFFNGKESKSVIETDVPSSNMVKVYSFYFASFGKPLKVSISPIFSNGKEGETLSEVGFVNNGTITKEQAISKGLVKNVQTGKSILNEGLVGYWPFDSDTKDYSGNENNGVNNGGVVESNNGKVGKSMNFEAETQGIDLNQRILFEELTSGFAVSVWTNFTPTRNEDDRFVAFGQDVVGCQGFFLGVQNGFYEFEVDCVNFIQNDNFPFEVGWHLLTASYDGASVNFFVDTNLIGSTSLEGMGTDSITNTRIGITGYGASGWEGELDEVAVWNRSLSSAEVAQLYNSGKGLSLK